MAGEVSRIPVEEVQQMSIGTGDASAVGHKRADFRYSDLATRPAHITDKKGNFDIGHHLQGSHMPQGLEFEVQP